MRKLSLIALLLGVVLLAGCTGDDPSGPGGTLPIVTGLLINEAQSGGTTVVLQWNAVATNGPDAIDGYEIYFRETEDGTWAEVGDVADGTLTFSHLDASAAGYYSVRAYEGDNYSEDYAIAVNDLPNFISSSYTIWNNHAPADSHSGFIFGATSGTTCLAGQGGHDMYCYNGGQGNLTWLYSGDYGTFGGGNDTDFFEHASGYASPGAGPWNPPAGPMAVGDVIFAELYDGYWVKIYVTALPKYTGGTDNAYGITFYYDFQPIEGLELFTTDSQP